MRIHMVGIKGSGMSSLAIILKDLGHNVSGSDYDNYVFTQDGLLEHNIAIYKFSVRNLDGVDLVVVGHNFMNSDNEEVVCAIKKGIRILEYNCALNEIIKKYYSIAVCGSNGKSTTTALIASILDEYEDTSFLVGSGEGKGSKSKYFVFEACEYKEHFLAYNPNLILVNNIDYDHVDYFKNENDYKNAFYKFINNGKNIIVVNGDDKNLKDLPNVITFGKNENCVIRALNINLTSGIEYDLYYKANFIIRIKLAMYGEYMLYNTLAAISVCLSLGIDIEKIKSGLTKFKGVKRRFMETIIDGDVYIDDYAHHPSKISAIIDAVKSKYKDRKVIAFFRPDRITRLEYFSLSFLESLKKADEFYILPFINMSDIENSVYKRFMKNNNLEYVSEKIYSRVSKQKNVVYLMMSSKNMNEVREKILKHKG